MTAAQRKRSQHLRASYREAFREWAVQVKKVLAVHGFESGADPCKQVEARVKEAEEAYHEARNLMLDDMTTHRG